MVAHRGEPLVQSLEEAFPVVPDAARLAVHEALGRDDAPAERLGDGLVPEADSEKGNLARERLDGVERHAGGVRVAGAGREHDRRRLQRGDAWHVDRVVAHHLHLRAQRAHHLHEIVGERIVVVDHQDHDSSSANLTASNTAFDLLMVSSYSFSGSESATMPAPARIVTRPPSLTSVRMTMAKFMSPVSEK